ncbi:MAG TPA: ATP-dependent DNA helicase [Steroidobacteraceae bacterium]|nr:ATP-dependent DNA helicase [Steroidobacteraceae bacterium]
MFHLDDVFGPRGPLARSLPGFTPRRSQLAMAQRVALALENRAPLVIEAGTGTGKTFAYLVPALLSGRRVVISTGTRTLQDQLFNKDLPLVGGAIGVPARVALLKGRSNYLCEYRLKQLDGQRSPAGTRDRMLARVQRWATITKTGDLAEVPDFGDSHPLSPQVSSTRENCLGARCPEIGRCHVVEARRRAIEADVVIVNHHLLLADLALKEDGFGDLLGAVDAVILDEAHEIPDLATQFFGARFGSRQVELMVRDARTELGGIHANAATLSTELGAVEKSLLALTDILRATPKPDWLAADTPLADAAADLARDLRALAEGLDEQERSPGITQSAARATELAGRLDTIVHAEENEGARSVELTQRGFSLSLLPFDVAPRFSALAHGAKAAWVFTSATLSVGEDFAHFTSRLGLGDAETLAIASPFDYESQALLYLPPRLPDPASPAHTAAVVGVAVPLIEASAGGAFLLFTSHRALQRAAQLLRERWDTLADFPLLVQGEAPREQLLRRFREAGNAVLLGAASFWEGVDVKGDALRLVVIEKLPFASPDDALTKARIEHLKAQGGNAFREYQLPEAALALKQGVGRLIRSETDRGVVVICDPRLVDKPYGRVLRAALPPMPVTRVAADAERFLRRIAFEGREAVAPPVEMVREPFPDEPTFNESA